MKKYLITIMTAAVIAAWIFPASANETGGVDIHGFISQGYLKSTDYNYLANDSEEGSFSYNEIGLNFGKNITDQLRIGVQFFARDIGDVANDKITIDWAYADYRWKDWLGIRVGKIKLPLGLYNEIRDIDMLRTNIVLPQGIYSDMMRDTLIALRGLGVYGNFNMGTLGDLSYQGITGVLSVERGSGVYKWINSNLSGVGSLGSDIENDTAYCGFMTWNTPLQGLRLAYSYFNSVSNTSITFNPWIMGGATIASSTEGTYNIYSAEYIWTDLTLVFEYMDYESVASRMGFTDSTTSESYYFSASYRLNDWFEIGSYYSVTYPDKDDKNGDALVFMGLPDHGAWQKDFALSLRFDINENWIFKIEGHKVNGTADVLSVDNPTIAEEDWKYFTGKMTFSF